MALNILLKVAIISAVIWFLCIIGIIVWLNIANRSDIDNVDERLSSGSWGVPILGVLAFIFFVTFLITLIYGLKNR